MNHYPFSHKSVSKFICSTARQRNLGLSPYYLHHLNKSDSFHQLITWIFHEKGCPSVHDLDSIPLEELRIKMATLGYPTTQQELEQRIVPYVFSIETAEELRERRELIERVILQNPNAPFIAYLPPNRHELLNK